MAKNNSDKQLTQRMGRSQKKQVKQSAAPPEAIDHQDFSWSAGEIDHEYTGEWAPSVGATGTARRYWPQINIVRRERSAPR